MGPKIYEMLISGNRMNFRWWKYGLALTKGPFLKRERNILKNRLCSKSCGLRRMKASYKGPLLKVEKRPLSFLKIWNQRYRAGVNKAGVIRVNN